MLRDLPKHRRKCHRRGMFDDGMLVISNRDEREGGGRDGLLGTLLCTLLWATRLITAGCSGHND
ncbi:MAG: hypothetical protein AAGA56_09390 [Myxococcota bacterium]